MYFPAEGQFRFFPGHDFCFFRGAGFGAGSAVM